DIETRYSPRHTRFPADPPQPGTIAARFAGIFAGMMGRFGCRICCLRPRSRAELYPRANRSGDRSVDNSSQKTQLYLLFPARLKGRVIDDKIRAEAPNESLCPSSI